MGKTETQAPFNKMIEGVVADVNARSRECRSLPFIKREVCFVAHVLPLMNELQALGYSLEWDVNKMGYVPRKVEGEWVHPTIRQRS